MSGIKSVCARFKDVAVLLESDDAQFSHDPLHKIAHDLWLAVKAAAAKEELVTREQLVEALRDMVAVHCLDNQGWVNNFCLSVDADAMRLLAKLGILKIDKDTGRCLIGEWVK